MKMDSYPVNIAFLCKAFFTIGSVSSIAGVLAPWFRSQIMNYGPRGAKPITAGNRTSVTAAGSAEENEDKANLFRNNSDTQLKQSFSISSAIASLQVPHAWFTYFYVVSVASSIFWAHQILTRGFALRVLVSLHVQAPPSSDEILPSSEMSINQVVLAWSFMAIQGIRRLYESITLAKPSQAKMWVGLWVIGVAYYIVMGIAVWIEGLDALSIVKSPMDLVTFLDISKPSRKTFIAVPIFILASGIQHDCHVYLASLKKYTLPDHQLFRAIVCPHYTAECFVYLAIAIVAAPPGQLLNSTVLSGMGFVVSNLGVTADSTRKWYAEKFGAEKIEGRWRMLPYLY